MGFRYPNLSFFGNISTKILKVSLSNNFSGKVVALYQVPIERYQHLAGDGPVPVKFGPEGTDPNRKDARFTFHTRRAVQSAIADLLVTLSDHN